MLFWLFLGSFSARYLSIYLSNYLLVNVGGNEKFYWMKDEYDKNCSFVSNGNGGYVKCDANKAYLKIYNMHISSFSFRYDGTTDVEDLKAENGEVKARFLYLAAFLFVFILK